MIGLILLYVGAVLFVNGIWLLGRIQNREVAVINVFTGFVGVLVAIFAVALGAPGDITGVQLAAYVLLFAFTYLWVAYNQFIDADGRGLGYYCLFVAITAVPVAVITLSEANSTFTVWLGLSWIAWAVLWFTYYLLLGRQVEGLTRFTAYLTLTVGVVTAWIPGFLVLNGFLEI